MTNKVKLRGVGPNILVIWRGVGKGLPKISVIWEGGFPHQLIKGKILLIFVSGKYFVFRLTI